MPRRMVLHFITVTIVVVPRGVSFGGQWIVCAFLFLCRAYMHACHMLCFCLQATARLVTADKAVEKFWLSDAQAAVLTSETEENTSPFCLCGITQAFMEGMGKFQEIQNSVRTGRGLKYDDYGDNMTCAVCRDGAIWTRNFLVQNVKTAPGLSLLAIHRCSCVCCIFNAPAVQRVLVNDCIAMLNNVFVL